MQWDTAGQEKFRTITNSYYRGANGIIVVYDVTSTQTFEHLQMWIDEIKASVPSTVPVLLLGNKADLEASREVTLEQAREFADGLGIKLFETSAKQSVNVDEAFLEIAREIKARCDAGVTTIPAEPPAQPEAPAKSDCC